MMREPCQHLERTEHAKVCVNCGHCEATSKLMAEAMEDALYEDDIGPKPANRLPSWMPT